jgi:cyclic-di-AMP phosphodiesterase PgpH
MVVDALLGVVGWALITVLVGPTDSQRKPPPLGPADRDMVALRNFDDNEPVADLAARQARAAESVPVHYGFRKNAVTERIDGIRSAFRLVRPRFRLYLADRERLQRESAEADAKNQQRSKTRRTKRGRRQKIRHEAPPASAATAAELIKALDARFDDEMGRLRPDFEERLASQRGKLSAESFKVLREQGFSEEIELLLSDVVQVLLSQRIVRNHERFEDDLSRGILDMASRKRHTRENGRALVVDVDGARKLADSYVEEFVRRKRPSRFDHALLKDVAQKVARIMVHPTFERDIEATRAAEDRARDLVPKTTLVQYTRGQSLVKRGDVVTAKVQRRIQRMLTGLDTGDIVRAFAATGLLAAGMLFLFGAFARRYLGHLRRRPRDARLLAGILIVHTATLRLLLELGGMVVEPGGSVSPVMWAVLLPYALGPTLTTLFLRPLTAAPFALLCTGMATLMAHNALLFREDAPLVGIVAMESVLLGLAGVYSTRRFRQRSDLVLAALFVSGFGVLCAVAVALFTAPLASDILDLHNALLVTMGGATGVIGYLLVAALTPIFESVFNRLTDIKLLELTSMNHPALRVLATEAPGTFTHSVMVGNLAEAGCEAIGANGLLARVGAYYHDLGKTNAPRYFAENQTGDNPHDRLKPHLSALIIKSHVKDGIKILKGFGLPQEIIDCVPEHHGTSRIEHFYNLARRQAQAEGEDVEESDFRYPGPRPQTKETAVLMIADTVEAAAKALPDPNPARIEALVQRLIAKKREDGQLDDCDMTLRELANVERALTHVLVGMHHTRPAYLPPPTRNDRATMLASARAMRQKNDGAAREDDVVLQTMRMSKMEAEPSDTKPADVVEDDTEGPPPLTGEARPSSPTAVVSSERRKNAG